MALNVQYPPTIAKTAKSKKHSSLRRVVMNIKTAGFTLLEIMIVVSIIGLLTTIAVPSFMSSRETSQKQLCMENQRIIGDMLDVYCLDHGKAPLVGNFGSLAAVKAALAPVGSPDAAYLKKRAFGCPANGGGAESDYNMVTADGLIIGFECAIMEQHNE
jgi:prepilin-type N-terminal cleavage/methylation domain-containing protein